MAWVRLSFYNRRLSTFLLRRSDMGKRLVRGAGKLNLLAGRFTYSQREQIHSIRRGTSVIWYVARCARFPLVCAAFVIAILVGGPALYERLAISRIWPPLPLPAVASDTY